MKDNVQEVHLLANRDLDLLQKEINALLESCHLMDVNLKPLNPVQLEVSPVYTTEDIDYDERISNFRRVDGFLAVIRIQAIWNEASGQYER